MKTTVIQLEFKHTKELPKDVTDAVAQRAYSYLYSQGVEAGVSAKLMTEVPAKPQPWEKP